MIEVETEELESFKKRFEKSNHGYKCHAKWLWRQGPMKLPLILQFQRIQPQKGTMLYRVKYFKDTYTKLF